MSTDTDVNDDANDELETAGDAPLTRPRTRGECRGGVRPCPWVSCRYHLLVAANDRGELRFNVPGRQLPVIRTGTPQGDFDATADQAVDSMHDGAPMETCALDLIERNPDGMTLDEVGRALGITRQRVEQLEGAALEHLEKKPGGRTLLEGWRRNGVTR